MRIFLIVLLLGTTLFSRNELFPTSCCPAYNNMKHTRNSGDVHLDPRSGYEVKQHHKGQYLIQIPGANPAQRWVDESCLAPKSQLNVTPISCEVKPIEPKSPNRENPQISSENLLNKPSVISLYTKGFVIVQLGCDSHCSFCITVKKR